MPWIVVYSQSARQCLMIGTDTTLDQDWGTESDGVRMYIVHCLSLSTTSVDFNTLPLTWIATLMQDSWAKAKGFTKLKHRTRHFCQLILVQTVQCIEACPTTVWSWKSVCSLCHHRTFMGSKSYRQIQTWRQSVHKISLCICHCFAPCPCFASCNCCHVPFIVRCAQTCPPFTGFTQLAHRSRCSRSTLTTVCFCALVFRDHVGSLCERWDLCWSATLPWNIAG